MFGIGSTEFIVILVVALIVLGPKNLAVAARWLGRAMGEFRRVSTDFQRTINMEAAEDSAKAKTASSEVKNAAEENAETGMPEDSPIAKAIAKARKELEEKKEEAGKRES